MNLTRISAKSDAKAEPRFEGAYYFICNVDGGTFQYNFSACAEQMILIKLLTFL